jgi:hypothetical protein
MSKELKNNLNKGEIVLYKTEDGLSELSVQLKNDTIWLTQKQMSRLFQKDTDTIGLHIRNIYKEGELPKKSTTEYFSVVQKEGKRKVERQIDHYNLDVIISVGYRVKSKRGTQFRIWANKVLKEYLVKGYALNEKRLKEQTGKIKELEKSLEIFKRVADNYQLAKDEFSGILNVISDYTYALDILDQYDNNRLKTRKTEGKEEYRIVYEDSIVMIKNLKKKFGGSALFGKEKMNHSKVQSARFIRHSIKKNSIRVLKKRQQCFCI